MEQSSKYGGQSDRLNSPLTAVVEESDPARFVTIQRYVPPTDGLVMLTTSCGISERISSSYPSLIHLTVFPGPPWDEHVRVCSLPLSVAFTLAGRMNALPSGETAEKERDSVQTVHI